MISFIFSTKIYYKDIDRMGVVYYSRYLEFFEQARTELLDTLGLQVIDLERMGYYLPVVYTECKYIKSAGLEDKILIQCTIDELPKSKLTIKYRVYFEDDNTDIALGLTRHAFLGVNDNRPKRAPSKILNAFIANFMID